ncbi:hypothetical protein FKM82_011369 [Ascaphus truei]
MYCVCGCCGALRPRYKRLIDNIFPEDSEDGLVKANMEKLTFYALSAPEKLDRIGAYLSERLSRDVARHRYGYVCIAMEALDQLLMACHCQSINLFVESFLKMVAKLLESEKPNLQILGTNSFVKFANIEEDTPSYHRSYDFFVSRFSEMCHSSYDELEIRTKIRMAGIKGLQGVVRKTVNDELQANIWEPQHMDKIVPSLLYNLQHVEETESRSPSPLQTTEKEKESPAELAERCLRELLGRAAYGNIKNAIKPVLIRYCFSLGPTVLEMFNTLLRQLRLSIDYELTGSYDSALNIGTKIIKEHEERMFQESVIRTIGSFARTLPTYQRSEVMLFIMGKVPLPSLHHVMDTGKSGFYSKFSWPTQDSQSLFFLSNLKVSMGFQCSNMLTAMPSSFLDPLLSAVLMEDAEIRLFVLNILICLIDRHGNRHKFATISTVADIAVLKLKVDKCSRQDSLFMKKLANEEVVVDLIRLVLAVQELALNNEDNLPVYNRCAMVIEMRKEAPYLLPEDVFMEEPRLSNNVDHLETELLFLQSTISEVLGGSGYNSDRLSTPYVPQLTDEDRLSKRKSIGETISLQVEVESRNSPEKEERAPAEEITFETLKKAIVDSVAVEEQERERRRQVVEKFQKAPFEEIAAHCGARAMLLQSKLDQIFELTIRPPPSPSGTITAAYGQSQNHSIPVYEMKFPDLCVY